MTIPGSKKAILYDKLHKFSVYSMMGIGIATFGLVVYNCYLFKRGSILASLITFVLCYSS